MKKLLGAFVVISLAVLPAAVACDKEHGTATQSAEFGKGPVKDVVLTGYLTDSNCGKANAHAGGADCAKKCIKAGAKVQLVADSKTYTGQGRAAPRARGEGDRSARRDGGDHPRRIDRGGCEGITTDAGPAPGRN